MGRFVKRGERGIQILAPMIGYRRRNSEAAQNTDADGNTEQPPVLIGFRAVYVFERLSRDLGPGFYALDGMRPCTSDIRRRQPYYRSILTALFDGRKLIRNTSRVRARTQLPEWNNPV
jgi:hypothetical protein